MNDITYKVLFEGVVLPGFAEDQVRDNLSELFNADEERIERLFSGKPYTVRKEIPEWKAREYEKSIQAAGGQCRILSMDGEHELEPASADDSDLSLDDSELGASSMVSRMGRSRCLAMSWLVVVLEAAAFLLPDNLPRLIGGSLSEGQSLMLVIAFHASAALLTLYLVIARLHDMDRSAWLALFLLIPGLNLLFLIYLALGQGTEDWNRFGEEPEPPGIFAIVLGAYAPIFTVMLAATGAYLSQDILMAMDLPELASAWINLENLP